MDILKALANTLLLESDRFSQIYMDDDDIDHDHDIYELHSMAEKLVRSSGINIVGRKDLSTVIVDNSTGKVVGGLWTNFDGDEFSFDVAVDKQYQRQGIGNRLIDIGMSEFQQYDDMDAKLNLHVTNPILPPVLKRKYGLRVVDKHPDGSVSMAR